MAKKKRNQNINGQVAENQEKSEVPPTDESAVSSEQEKEKKVENSKFPIVGVGASAGGLEALEQFFQNMTSDYDDQGIAFVVVQHLLPDRKSIMTELIKGYTKIKVFEVADGMKVEPNCAYIIPPNRDMAILHGVLQLMQPATHQRPRLPIDSFFRSLAQDKGDQAICIILSGTGTDGTLGLRAIKGEGGMAIVQEPESAQYDGMPRSAIATGLVDYILPPSEMPKQLVKYIQHAFGQQEINIITNAQKDIDWLQKVFVLLRDQTGHDFTHYKHNTILRRIERRMTVHQISDSLSYVRYLQENPEEIQSLFKELLIGVTNFFRDPNAFEVLNEKAIPNIINSKPSNQPIRIWAPGCSTGEEAYSIAILIQENMEKLKKNFQVQIFATDIDSAAINTARMGIYPSNIAVDITPERLQRFFTKKDSTYQINRLIRDMLVFSLQNAVKDQPFSRIDLVSCRNLLIYIGDELQKKLLSLFHYSLNQDGYLFLGTSESTSGFDDFFAVVDRKWKLFQRKGAAPDHRSAKDNVLPVLPVDRQYEDKLIEKGAKLSLRSLTEKIVLESYSPAVVIIDEKCEILYVHGYTGKYLEHSSGLANLNILGMAREGLRFALTTSIRKAISQKKDIYHNGLQVKTNGGIQIVDLIVKPISDHLYRSDIMMVIFKDIAPPKLPESATESHESKNERVMELERELEATKEYLQTTIEELETSNEELKSTNEELQSSNEELQSANEELETSREELQSVNEELSTVNSELENKLELLAKSNNDMNNLMASTEIATVFLDNNLHIKRYTPKTTQAINLIQTDIGRPLAHIVSNMYYDNLVEDARLVLETLIPKEIETQSNKGLWYSIRILPYRTTDNVIEGVVITFVDITEQKKDELLKQHDLLENNRYITAIFDTMREPLLVLDADLKIALANRSFYSVFQVSKEETQGKFIYDLGDGHWNIPELRRLLEDIIPENTVFNDFQVTHTFPTIGQRVMLLNARQIENEKSKAKLILLALEDVTNKQ